MRDETLLLGSDRLNVGVFTPAEHGPARQSDLAVLCLTAGLLHHVGPHRMHVLLARALARLGIGSLRLDFSGIGDSSVRVDDLPAEEVPLREINDAIGELETRGFHRFVLFGLCSGAVHAAKAALGNHRIAGIVMVNTGTDDGNVDVDASAEAAAQVYLKSSVRNPTAWKNLFTGKVRYRQLIVTLLLALRQRLKGRGKPAISMEAELRKGIEPFTRQGTSVLMVMSDRHAQFYASFRKDFENLQLQKFETLVYPDTDHLFSSLEAQRELIDQVCRWSVELAR